MSQKTKEILLAILALIVLVGLGFLAFKYVKLPGKTGKTTNTEINNTNSMVAGNQVPGFTGKVVSIGVDSIKVSRRVKDGTEDKEVKIDNKTEYYKNYMDPMEKKFSSAAKSDLKEDIFIGITYTSDSKSGNLVAQRIDILINNVVQGAILSKTESILTVKDKIDNKNYDVKIDNGVKCYEQTIMPSAASNQTQSQEKPKEISCDNIKINDQAVVFLSESKENDNLTTGKILKVNIK